MLHTIYLFGGTDGTENFGDLWLLKGAYIEKKEVVRSIAEEEAEQEIRNRFNPQTKEEEERKRKASVLASEMRKAARIERKRARREEKKNKGD